MASEKRVGWLHRHGLYGWPEFLDGGPSALRIRQTNLAHNLMLVARFRQVVADAGVPVMPIKGVYLLAEAYEDRWDLRKTRDVDVIVSPRDFVRALDSLRDLGYEFMADSVRVPSWARFHQGLVKDGIKIEVHSGLTGAYGVSMDALRPREGSCHGVRCLVPCAARHTAFLSQHFLRHVVYDRYCRFGWAEEVYQLLRRSEAEVRRAAEEMGYQSCLDLLDTFFEGSPEGTARKTARIRWFRRVYRLEEFASESVPTPRGLFDLATRSWPARCLAYAVFVNR
jgi:Uncharacterised nucleotidyltransferase